MMALSKTTQDHDEIRQWAESRGAKPAEVERTERSGQTGILRLEFPSATNANDGALKEISWDEFFEKFDASGLELVYQEETADGQKSNFNKLIYPEDSKSQSAKKSSAKKSPAKKSPAKAMGAKSTGSRSSGASSTRSKRPAKSAPAKAAKKAHAKKAVAKKTPAKKAPAKKTSAKKAPTKKAPSKKSPAKKSSGSKSASSRLRR